MTPELKARVSIDALLVAAGWHACNVADAHIHAVTGVAIHEFSPTPCIADDLFYVNGSVCCNHSPHSLFYWSS
jgi:type I restriction enzyme, R subunit